ncbi:MAG: aldose 1-epimerase family protein [Anaerolineae bacterium]|nr:aldose 1-epimerase family protein [Anaerolineae bacterium]
MRNADWLQRDRIIRHSLEMRQFIDFRESTMANGNRLIEAYNSSGFSFTVLPDRGLDIWSAHYNGMPLTWLSAGSPHPPAWGQSWLREFNGGLLTTCGLTHAGPPESEPITAGGAGLHGLYTRLHAYRMAINGAWEGNRYVITLKGTVTEAMLSGEQLVLERTYRWVLGEPSITWTDTITNAGIFRTPLMILYHINLGYPLVRAGSQLDVASDARPRDPEARKGFADWQTYEAPHPDYLEQVFFHHVNAAANGIASATLFTGDFGIQVSWDTFTLPYFTQWKNTRQGMYVCGVEPGNCIPEGQVAARDTGRLIWAEPGDSVTTTCTLNVLDGADAVAAARAQIAQDRASGAPVAGVALDDYPA